MAPLKVGLSIAVVVVVVGVFAQVLSGAVHSFTDRLDSQTSQVK